MTSTGRVPENNSSRPAGGSGKCGWLRRRCECGVCRQTELCHFSQVTLANARAVREMEYALTVSRQRALTHTAHVRFSSDRKFEPEPEH